MPRHILDESRIHPAIRGKVAGLHADIVERVRSAVAAHDVLIVGMKGNPHCSRARKSMAAAGVTSEYLEFGSYLNQWRPRNALKMWTGWPTFPMVFVKGQLVGGASDLQALVDSGELGRMMAA